VRALATSPGLLLLDEPLSALDARVRLDLRGKLKDLQRRLGVTTIMVTHDQSEALTIADRIVVMNHGRVEQVGAPVEVYQRPSTPFVADFLGTTNFLRGIVAADGRVRLGRVELACETGTVRADSAVTLAWRPESTAVRGIRRDDPNVFESTISSLEFNGSFYRGHLVSDAAGDASFIADFSANAVNDLRLRAGETIVVAVPAQHLRVFPAA
jgi:iron(III) transport system ATP-binding protein